MVALNKNTTDGTDKFVTTYYVRDPQGNVLAVYEHKHGDSGNGTFTLTEQHLYGAGRLGMRKRDLALNVTNASEPTPVTHYELTNHLGNVMAVISDEASTAARAGGTNSSIKMMIKIKINKYAVMKKKYIYIFILLFMIMSCDLKKDKGVPMNYREIPDSVLEKLVIEKGDTSAYYDLFVSYLDYSPEKFLPYALIMANKYNYPQAYYDVYDRLWYLYENSDSLDVTTKKIALEYLEKAAQKGHTQARQTLEEYLEHESSVATR